MLKGHGGARFGKVVSLLLAACIVFVMIACDQQSGSNLSNSDPITVGLSVPKTGGFSSDGTALLQGYQIWANYVNTHGGLYAGRAVQLDILYDDSSNAKVVSNYQTLIKVHHDDLIVGPYSSTLTLSAAGVAQHYNYAFIEGAGVAPGIFTNNFNNLFSVSLSASAYLKSFVYYLLSMPQALRPKSIAYVTSDDFFTEPQVDGAQSLLEAGGIRTAWAHVYPAATTVYTSIAQQTIAKKPDVVILGTTGQQDAVALTKAFITQHFNPKALVETAGPDQGSQFTGPIGGAAQAEGIFVPNNGWFPTIKTFQNSDFVNAYIAKYGGTAQDISADSVEAFSVGQVLQQAITKTNSINNNKLIQELHSGATFNSIQGAVKFENDGENSVAEPFLFQWQSNNLIPVYPANQAQANPEYPKRNWS